MRIQEDVSNWHVNQEGQYREWTFTAQASAKMGDTNSQREQQQSEIVHVDVVYDNETGSHHSSHRKVRFPPEPMPRQEQYCDREYRKHYGDRGFSTPQLNENTAEIGHHLGGYPGRAHVCSSEYVLRITQ